MAKRRRKSQKSEAEVQDFVVVTLAEDLEQARDYETLLKTNDIPTTIKEQNEESTNAKSIAVMVPEDFIDEAHVVIESQDAYDDFYDLSLEDEDNGDLDSDLFDNDF
jgi:dTDP-glucose pyrophosphorylase